MHRLLRYWLICLLSANSAGTETVRVSAAISCLLIQAKHACSERGVATGL